MELNVIKNTVVSLIKNIFLKKVCCCLLWSLIDDDDEI